MSKSRWLSPSLLFFACAALACGPSANSSNDDGEGESSGESGQAQVPTWYQDIAPLVHQSCGGCHRDGGIAPFSVDDYETAKSWGPLMLEAVEAGTMPPWGAENTDICETVHDFKDDPRLSADQEAMLADWIAADMPEGDPDNPADLIDPASTELEDSDLRLTIPSGVEVDGDKDRFTCFVMEPELGSPLNFINGIQVNPGNDKIVHHVLIYATDSAEVDALAGDDGAYECFGSIGVGNLTLVGGWAPGMPPFIYPDEAPGILLDTQKLVVQVHYHPTGAGPETDDSTSVDIRWHEGTPPYVSQLRLFGNAANQNDGLLPGPNDTDDVPEFRIPAGEADHVESMMFFLPPDFGEMRLWSVGTHMHYIGTDMAIGVQRYDGSDYENACLVNTPRWDFNWQRAYVYDVPFEEAPILEGNDRLYLSCRYNNTLDNPAVAAALAEQGLSEPQDVFLGDETLDEMCIGIFGLAVPIADALP